MADYAIPWTPAPDNNRLLTLSDVAPSAMDMLNVAAYGDAQYERRLRNRLAAMATRDKPDAAPAPRPSRNPPSAPQATYPATPGPGQQAAYGAYQAYPAPGDRSLSAAKEKLAPIMSFAKEAIAAGDNDALQRLITSAKADPDMSKLIPKDFSISVAGAGQVKMTQAMDMGRLRDLAFRASDPLVRRQIMQARAGQPYEYEIKDGKIAGFRPAGAAPGLDMSAIDAELKRRGVK